MERMLLLVHYAWKPGFLVALVLIAISISRSTVSADHEKFQYKFPCLPADACYITTLAHVGNAFDFDPKGNAGLGVIPAVSEGIFRGYITANSVCTWPNTTGLGKYAVVDDLQGRTLRYAHLSSFGNLLDGTRVLQGDIIGIEGNTGNTTYCTPHLHLEGISTTSYIDGISVASLHLGWPPYESTNSRVGDTDPSSEPGFAIRQVFKDFGNAFGPGGSSWGLFGWTADLVSPSPPPVPQVGCAAGNPYCQLYVHYEPDPQAGHWGSILDFRKHPEPVKYEGVSGTFGENSIMVGDWDMNSAYVVTPPFYNSWLWGDTMVTEDSPSTGPIGLPLMHWVDASSGQNCGIAGECCAPLSTGCLNYQRFSHGYIWEHYLTGVLAAVICPDVAGAPWPDYHVDLFFDILGVIAHYSITDPSLYDPQFDINGDGDIDLFIDILGIIAYNGKNCVPSP